MFFLSPSFNNLVVPIEKKPTGSGHEWYIQNSILRKTGYWCKKNIKNFSYFPLRLISWLNLVIKVLRVVIKSADKKTRTIISEEMQLKFFKHFLFWSNHLVWLDISNCVFLTENPKSLPKMLNHFTFLFLFLRLLSANILFSAKYLKTAI